MSKHLVSRVPRARQRTPRLDGPVFPSGQDRRDLSSGGGGPVRPSPCPGKGKLGGKTRLPWSGKSSSGFQLTGLDGETSLSMVTKTVEWVSIAALLMTVPWRPLWRRRLRLWLQCQHKGRSSGPSNSICSQYAHQDALQTILRPLNFR